MGCQFKDDNLKILKIWEISNFILIHDSKKCCENNSTTKNIITKMCQLSRHFPLRMPKTDSTRCEKCTLNVVFLYPGSLSDCTRDWEIQLISGRLLDNPGEFGIDVDASF